MKINRFLGSSRNGVIGLPVVAWIILGGLGAARAEPPEAYQGPCALAASKDGKSLYVANADARQVAWVELAGGTVTRRVSVPGEPTGLTLTPDGTKLIVAWAAML